MGEGKPIVAEAEEEIDPSRFRRLMSRWATGVSIVTARDGEVDFGLTVNAFLSVSLSPPTVLVSITHDTDTAPIIDRSGRFGITVLAADQKALSERFARTIPPDEKFHGLKVRRGRTGVALFDGGLAFLECRTTTKWTAGDHGLYLGEVESMEEGRDATPLLFYRSRYARSDKVDEVTLAPPPP